MNKLLFLISFLVCTSSVVAQKYKGDSWSKVKSTGSGSLTVVYYEQPGLITKSSDGKMKGVCVDILADFKAYVKTKHQKEIIITYAGEEKEFSNFLKVAQTIPNVLCVTNTSITEERKKIMKFTPPFMTTQLVLLTNKNTPSITSLKELTTTFKGFTGLVITGSTHEKYMNELKKRYNPGLEISYAPSSDLVIQNLSTNTKMFSILDFTEYIGVVRNKLPIKRQEVELGNPEPLGFVMSKTSDWDEIWNEFLTDEYRKSVRYKEIIADNLGSSFLSLVR